MSDSTGNFGNTITSGVQEISALLPLLGTEQCEEHVSSGLTRGYFYVAATPLSIFGSLGLARAAFKTLVASISIPSWNFHGARILADAGFWGVGDNLPLILLDQEKRLEKEEAAVEEKSKKKSEVPLVWGAPLERRKRQKHGHNFPSPQYLAGSRLHSLLKDLRVHEDSSITVRTRCSEWNIFMIAFTAVSCLISIVPYIYLNTNNHLPPFTHWAFPVTRALGGFLCATMIPLIIEIRLRVIVEEQLRKRAKKEPKLLVDQDGQLHRFLLIFQILLFFGVVGSVAGYVGCFTVVQNSSKPQATISWLLLEAGLSIIRIFLWGVNPGYDDAPPFSLSIKLSDNPPLPTCNKYAYQLEGEAILPMVRADDFLPEIMSYVGQVERFSDPRYALYYTLTCESESSKRPLLYITVFDLTEHTGWIYTCAPPFSPSSTPSSSATSSPTFKILRARSVDVDEHNVPQAKIDVPKRGIRPLRRDIEGRVKVHYLSIMDQLMLRFGDKHIQQEGPLAQRHGITIPHRIPLEHGCETLITKWTLMTRDTRSQRLQYEANRQRVMEAVKGKLEDGAWHDGLSYLNFSSKWREIEKKVLELYHDINDDIVVCTTWLRVRLTSLGEKEQVVNWALENYWSDMEKGLLEEVHRWECRLWDCHQQMTKELDGDRLKEQAVCDWSTNSWNRLNHQVCGMEQRMKKLEYKLNARRLGWDWHHLIESMTNDHPSRDFEVSLGGYENFYLYPLSDQIHSIMKNLQQQLLQCRTSLDLQGSQSLFGCRMIDLLRLNLTRNRLQIRDKVVSSLGVDGVLKAINENPFKDTILQVDFREITDSDALVKLAAVVNDMPRLTCIRFLPLQRPITKEMVAILREIRLARDHSIHIYVGWKWDQWEETPAVKIAQANSSSISLWGFTAEGNFDEMRATKYKSQITLNFQAPTEGNVVLKITHRYASRGSSTSITIRARDKKSLMKVPVEGRNNFHTETIKLKPQDHFDLEVYNTVELIVNDDFYILQSLELAAEDGTLLLSMPWREPIPQK
ncbi:hypothetical protein D9758_015882 [Tetrapyrgos nigripes]|uniref:Uncharacterized protein n=1 Tax=Tetrapyrgos nigripes TaxID=182062 RepID=A0A8H5CLD9_9AGAR|nr:hypothetical protein D9758_015882 [Tetrapyrgos nigripes]